MEHPVIPKVEASTPADSAPCTFCLAPQGEVGLRRRNLTAFYSEFGACGLGTHTAEGRASGWVCQYCCVRAGQCLRFIECARTSERALADSLSQLKSPKEFASFQRRHRPPVVLAGCVIPHDVSPTYDGRQRFIDVGTAVANVHPITHARPRPDYFEDFAALSSGTPQDSDGSEAEDKVTVKEEDIAFCKVETVKITLAKAKGKRAAIKKEVSKEKILKREGPSKDCLKRAEKWRELEVELLDLTEKEQREEIERRRQSEKYLKWAFKCDKCGVGFQDEECIERHNSQHLESRGAYECKICHLRFATAPQRSTHASYHRRRWRCLRCSQLISSRANLTIHLAKCTNSEPVACEECGKMFKNKYRLGQHQWRSHKAHKREEKRYICDNCGHVFKDKNFLKNHVRIHTGEMPYECEICGKKSRTVTTHQNHKRVHSEVSQTAETYCVECDRYFRSKYLLRAHLKQSLKHNTKDNFKFPCAYCSERFPDKRGAHTHMNIKHLNNRTHACEQCDKAYFTQSSLAIHVKEKHTQYERTRDHVCSACGKAFTHVGQLKQHMRTHTKERPYACLLCPATFGFNAALYTHNKLKHKMTTAQVHKKLNIKRPPGGSTKLSSLVGS